MGKDKDLLEYNLKEQKEKLVEYIKKFHDNKPNKYKADVHLIDDMYNKVKDGNIYEAKDMLDALEYKYKNKKRVKSLGTLTIVLAVIVFLRLLIDAKNIYTKPEILRRFFKPKEEIIIS